MSAHSDELRDFLRASRAKIRPEDVGLPAVAGIRAGTRSRRVPGLRREEVAQIAGVSVDYFARLEQGRTKDVSRSVLDAIADALRLNPVERDYLVALVALQTASPVAATATPPATVRPSVARTLSAFETSPAVVMGRGMQLLAMNALARSVFFDFTKVPVAERNLARWIFLAPEARQRYGDWEERASEAVAVVRADAGAHPDDGDLLQLVGELTVKSDDFRRLWAEHHVFRCTWGTVWIAHPVVGRLDLDYEALAIPGAVEQNVVVYLAPEGSPSAESLALLSSWNAKQPSKRSIRA
jgi:transcriptional regulator with XRE-family HTH domain